MDTNKFYKIRYNLNGRDFVYRGIYLGRDGNLISVNEMVNGQMLFNEANVITITEITDEDEILEIQQKIKNRGDAA